MPRQSRQRLPEGIYFIRQQAADGEVLFPNQGNRDDFLSLVRERTQLNGMDLLAFACPDDSSYYLLVAGRGGDISQLMKEINIGYAMKRSCPGCLFRDRFQSEVLQQQGIWHKLEPEEALGSWQTSLAKEYGFTWHEEKLAGDCPWDCQERMDNVGQVQQLLDKDWPKHERDNKEIRNQWICRLRQCSNLSLKEIGGLFQLSESTVSKIIKESWKEKEETNYGRS